MRTIKLIAVVVILLVISASCHHSGSRITVNNGVDRLEISYNGEIKFTEDETAIKSISPHGHLKYRKNDKKLEVQRGANGTFKLEMSDDGRKLNPEDKEGKQFLAEAIKEMISVGFDAKERMRRIFKNGGSPAILDEVAKVNSDFTKSMYLEFLLSQNNIQQGEITEIADIIASQVNSDFEKGKLLNKFSADLLKDSLTSNAYFTAVRSIGSDFEKANALKNILKKGFKSDEQWIAVINQTAQLGSEFDRSNILIQIARQMPRTEPVKAVYLEVAKSIQGEMEFGKVVKAIGK